MKKKFLSSGLKSFYKLAIVLGRHQKRSPLGLIRPGHCQPIERKFFKT
jgi:hypothetical protein